MARIGCFLSLFCLLIVFPLVFAQPPAEEGKDSKFLEAAQPPPSRIKPRPSPGRSVAPEKGDLAPGQSPPPLPSVHATFSPFPLPNFCRRQPVRMLSGRCTSATQSIWGESQRTQFSYLRDHTSRFPAGKGLKSAREISNILSDQRRDIFNSKNINELFVFFGQFVDHNLVATPATGQHFDIEVPPGDPKFPAGKKLPFTRSTRGFTGEGTNERPINTLSSALDLSAVYGANSLRNKFLVDMSTGKMKTSPGNLPPLNSQDFNNAPNSKSPRFYLTGDHRANEHPVLTSLHTLFMREHNRLVDLIRASVPERRLRRLSPFQLARQINIAQFQKIVYEEFIPAIFGRKFRRYPGYRPLVDPTVSDIFAGAAFRVGHTMVGNDVTRRGPGGPLPPFTLSQVFFRELGLKRSDELDNLIRGAANKKAQEVDLLVHDVLRNMLFDKVNGEEGFDLVALNIQRGRDHVLPTFNEIRRIFKLPEARTFSQISSDTEVVKKLERAYESVDAVEAWPGLVAEDKAPGAGIGETMLRVWEAEFSRLSQGDQFFYLRRNKAISRPLNFYMEDTIDAIYDPRKKMFREIILRNSGVSAGQIPTRDIFKS